MALVRSSDLDVIVAERGARLPIRGEDGGRERLMLVQRDAEPRAEFANRVRKTLRRVCAEGRRPIREATLLGDGSGAEDARAHRASICQALTALLSPKGRLLLGAVGEDRYGMKALATTTAEFSRDSLTVGTVYEGDRISLIGMKKDS